MRTSSGAFEEKGFNQVPKMQQRTDTTGWRDLFTAFRCRTSLLYSICQRRKGLLSETEGGKGDGFLSPRKQRWEEPAWFACCCWQRNLGWRSLICNDSDDDYDFLTNSTSSGRMWYDGKGLEVSPSGIFSPPPSVLLRPRWL